MPPSQDPARRAVVTGLGAVMPIGNDFETYWRNLRDGVSGVATITRFDPSEFEVKIAAEVKDFVAGDHMDAKMARRMSRFTHFAMAATSEALDSAGLDPATLDPEERDRVGVVINTGGGGLEQVVDGTLVRGSRGPRFVSPFAIPALSGSMAACMVSMEYGLTGPVMTQVAACATSVIAFHDALRLIADGRVRRRPGRRDGGADPGGRRRRAGQHGRALEAERRPDAGLAPVRPRPRRLRPGRGRGRGGRRVAGPCAGARGDAAGGGPRRRPDGRRLPHLGAGADRARAPPGRCRWPASGPA